VNESEEVLVISGGVRWRFKYVCHFRAPTNDNGRRFNCTRCALVLVKPGGKPCRQRTRTVRLRRRTGGRKSPRRRQSESEIALGVRKASVRGEWVRLWFLAL
jgi:hypothetical protein